MPIKIADNQSHSEFVEVGAQWVHGQGNPVYKLAESRGLLSSIVSSEGQGIVLSPVIDLFVIRWCYELL